MPRKREKTRLDHLADALAAAHTAGAALGAIDLRTTSGELRAAVKGAREAAETLRTELQRAILADVPHTATH